MTLYEYRKLDLLEKALEAWAGTNIATRIDREHYILLCELYDFYVEIYFHIDFHRVVAIKSFSNEERFNPYLDQLHVKAFL